MSGRGKVGWLVCSSLHWSFFSTPKLFSSIFCVLGIFGNFKDGMCREIKGGLVSALTCHMCWAVRAPRVLTWAWWRRHARPWICPPGREQRLGEMGWPPQGHTQQGGVLLPSAVSQGRPAKAEECQGEGSHLAEINLLPTAGHFCFRFQLRTPWKV